MAKSYKAAIVKAEPTVAEIETVEPAPYKHPLPPDTSAESLLKHILHRVSTIIDIGIDLTKRGNHAEAVNVLKLGYTFAAAQWSKDLVAGYQASYDAMSEASRIREAVYKFDASPSECQRDKEKELPF